MTTATGSFQVAGYIVRPELNRIIGPDSTERIEPKIMSVLLFLVRHRGEVLSRQRILDSVWSDTVVGEEVVSRAISSLRSVFDDDPRHPSIIETIPKSGYRFIAEITWLDDGNGPLPRTDVHTRSRHRSGRRLSVVGVILGVVVIVLALSGYLLLRSTAGKHIRIVASDGVDPLTTYPGQEIEPVWSPDDSILAFVWSGKDGHLDIYTRSAGIDTPVQLTRGPRYEYSPSFSPDGTEIAFSRFGSGIHAVSVSGDAERLLTTIDSGASTRLDWSPTEPQIAFVDEYERSNRKAIFLLNTRTSDRRSVTRPSATENDDYPAFSPDGTRIAFARSHGQTGDIHVISAEGGSPRRLTRERTRIAGITWSADGTHIMYSSNKGGTYGIWAVPADGGEPYPVLRGDNNYRNPAASHNGDRLAFSSSIIETNIWHVESAGRTMRPYLVSTRRDEYPQFSGDGKSIAFVSTRSGNPEIWISPFGTADAVQITVVDGPQVSTPMWSPGDSVIAFTSHARGSADIYLIHPTGRALRRITHHDADEVVSGWSKDGTAVYFSSNRTGRWQIWRQTVGSDSARRITTDGGRYAQESPDGNWIYVSRSDEPGIWKLPVEGGTAVRITSDLIAPYWGNWTVREQGLYFVNAGVNPPALNLLDPESMTTREVAILPEGPYWEQPSITVSPDGEHILYARLDDSRHDILSVALEE